jgi:hypothetical protein
MADRDDAALRHFRSRSQQPKILSSAPSANTPVNVFVVFDQGFGSVSDQVDTTRFKYTGTSPQLSRYEGMSNRRTITDSMKHAFEWQ